MSYDASNPYGNNSDRSAGRIFYTVVVADFITNPASISKSRLKSLRAQSLAQGVSNSDFVTRMPRNSILGYKVSDGEGDMGQLEIFYPFFSPHLCLPVKPGEQVWVMYETINGDESLGYWMTRKCVDLQVDDINYTHADRMNTYRNKRETGGTTSDLTDPIMPDFPNGDTLSSEGRTLKHRGGYKRILQNSIAFGREGRNQFIGEPVPRISKDPGDTVLQGSNNTSIVLGTEVNPAGSNTNRIFPKSTSDTNQGAIDICAGRGQTSKTATAFTTKGVENERGYREASKYPAREFKDKGENIAEGFPDFTNDLSRIYLSMKTSADEKFSINIDGIDQTEGGQPAIVLKTAQLRLVAHEDLKIVIGEEGVGSAVVLKSDGNIVFVPGPSGIIKLGGEDADKVILTTTPQFTTDLGGSVTPSTPVQTSAGGVLGNPEATTEASPIHFSTFASKILVK